jgi:hypothetical protein
MNIDERLEALAVRHEALTQSVDLLLQQTQTDAKNIRALERATQTDAENIRALARIATIHEHRLTALEGGPHS